jgi:hypothetical protein
MQRMPRMPSVVAVFGCALLVVSVGASIVRGEGPSAPASSASPTGAPQPLPPVDPADPIPLHEEHLGPDLSRQTATEAALKSHGCISCHQGVGDMHRSPNVHLGCTDCHGGDPCATTKQAAHVHPKHPEAWPGSANPQRSYTLLNHESADFVRFVNPGDLRVAHVSCGGCHASMVLQVRKSMMTHGCMLWNSALYNNGAISTKPACFGESYSPEGRGQRLQTVPPPTDHERRYEAVVRFLDPLPRFERQQPGNILRIFERGGRFRPEIGNPERLEENGRPRTRLSVRGRGCSTPRSTSLARTTSPATTAPAAAPDATWSTPTTVRRSTPARTTSTATAASASPPTRRSRATRAATRSTTSLPPATPFPRVSAWSATSIPERR